MLLAVITPYFSYITLDCGKNKSSRSDTLIMAFSRKCRTRRCVDDHISPPSSNGERVFLFIAARRITNYS